jgi:hypothetical protein
MKKSELNSAVYMRLPEQKCLKKRMDIAPSFFEISKNLKAKTILAAEAQRAQRKSLFTLRVLCPSAAKPFVVNHYKHGSRVFRSSLFNVNNKNNT